MIYEDYLGNVFSLSKWLQKGKILVSIFSYPRFTGLISREVTGTSESDTWRTESFWQSFREAKLKIKKCSSSLRDKPAGRQCRKTKIFPFLIIKVKNPLRKTRVLSHFSFLLGSSVLMISGWGNRLSWQLSGDRALTQDVRNSRVGLQWQSR